MRPGRWQEVERLYNAAMEQEPAQRAAFLAKACAGDESLRAEVESLLAHGERAGSFIEAYAMEMVAREIAGDSAPSQGSELAGDSPHLDEVSRKPRKRAPWWMYAAAVVFLICAGVRYYAYLQEAVRKWRATTAMCAGLGDQGIPGGPGGFGMTA